MPGAVITLSPGEQQVARMLAKARTAQARGHGVVDQKIGPQSAEEGELNGIGAELAFCRLHNLYPDMTFEPRSGGHDAITRSGATVDVKSTIYKTGRLLVKLHGLGCDLYALMVGKFPTYRYAGFAPKEVVAKTIGDLGHGKSHLIDQDKLK